MSCFSNEILNLPSSTLLRRILSSMPSAFPKESAKASLSLSSAGSLMLMALVLMREFAVFYFLIIILCSE